MTAELSPATASSVEEAAADDCLDHIHPVSGCPGAGKAVEVSSKNEPDAAER